MSKNVFRHEVDKIDVFYSAIYFKKCSYFSALNYRNINCHIASYFRKFLVFLFNKIRGLKHFMHFSCNHFRNSFFVSKNWSLRPDGFAVKKCNYKQYKGDSYFHKQFYLISLPVSFSNVKSKAVL